MTEENTIREPYRHLGIRFYEADYPMSFEAGLAHHSDSPSEWQFQLRNGSNDPLFEGGLKEVVELILLGKLCKEKMVVTEPQKVGEIAQNEG